MTADSKLEKIAEIKGEILKRVRPTAEEKIKLESVRKSIMDDIVRISQEQGQHGILPLSVGSAERDTWLSGSHDIDVFISYPEDIPFDEFHRKSRKILTEMAKTGDSWEDRHSEHPYIHIRKEGFEVDLVPCFRVKSGACIKSSVDRTPFHCAYIKENIRGLEEDVLLLKQFMKGVGVYGSEVRTGGFSGYLTEILVICYGGFESVLEHAALWKYGVVIDLAAHQSLKHEHPLVVVDPTDPKRNVAAALSLTKFARFIDRTRSFMKYPSADYFKHKEYAPMSADEFEKQMAARGTEMIGVSFQTPSAAEDTLYPQLFRMELSLEELFLRNEFTAVNTFSWSEESGESIVFIELLSAELPPLQKRFGPPVWNANNAETFCRKYKTSPDTFSFAIENEKYVAEVPRKYKTAESLIDDLILKETALGRHIRDSVKNGYRILRKEDIMKIQNENFWKFINEKLTAQIEP
ncbi:MAG: CCA tRNA nucleotidyltransferase [Methanosarcinales archaeon]|nr:CCA tRNA nucleotidyltransferase [Methanosarcinales archaeon]